MGPDKYYDYVRKLNQIFMFVFFFASIVFVFWLVVSIVMDSREVKPGDVPISTKSDSGTSSSSSRMMRLGEHQRLVGTDTILAQIYVRSGEATYGYSDTETRNLLFISRSTDEARLLFPHTDYLIRQYKIVRDKNSIDEGYGNVKAILCELVKKDTNQDGHLSDADDISVILVSVDGKHSQEILATVDAVMSLDTMPGQQISILYQNKGKVLNKRVHSTTFETLSDVILFNLESLKHHG